MRNYGFSDATEIFVFISGYTAVIAYSNMMRREAWPRDSGARLSPGLATLRRAHFIIRGVHRPSRLGVGRTRHARADRGNGDAWLRTESLLSHSGSGAAQVAADQSRRPATLHCTACSLPVGIASGGALATGCRRAGDRSLCCDLPIHWNLPAYPDDKVWFFNPMAWQVIFHVGAASAVLGPKLSRLDRFRWQLTALATAFLLFSAFIALSWHYNSLERLVPDWVGRQIYPIDKTNLDVLRLLHFLAVAWLVRLLVPIDAPFLNWRIWRPLRRCGEHRCLFSASAHFWHCPVK